MKQWTFLICAALIGLVSCNGGEVSGDQPKRKLQIVATTGMIADLVHNIGQDSVNVLSLMGPGVDPHLYKATQGDLKRLQSADVIFYNGLHLEGKMGEVLEKLGRIQPVIAVSSEIDPSRFKEDPAFQGNYDPHIWFDVSLWAETIPTVLEALKKEDPANAAYFEKNAKQLQSELTELHTWAQTEMATIPEGQRTLVTAHDAFSYFGLAYNTEVRGLQGISTLTEFGLRDRVDLVDFIVERGIKAVFVETSVSEKNVKSIVESCQQKGHDVKIGGSLYSDAMGETGTPEGTYQGMVRANVKTIVNALK